MTVFPDGFLWGAATSAHQIEGNNVNSDWWAYENREAPLTAEPSLDACDSLHRWSQDLDLLAEAGLNTYRFSVEWARIEPEPGVYSRAMLDHYQRMVHGCRERGVEPVVTLHHFTNPRWARADGSWMDDQMVDHFKRYADWVLAGLRDVQIVCTINEPNMTATYAPLISAGVVTDSPAADPAVTARLAAAHRHAVDVAHAQGLRAGWTLAMTAYDCPDSAAARGHLAEHRALDEDAFLHAAAGDAFLGVQVYTRRVVTDQGVQPMGITLAGPAERTTMMGWTFAPDALGDCLRRAHELLPDTPLLVTENGIATEHDEDRIEYTGKALSSVAACLRDGLPIEGYLHWSLLDNFEWIHGYGPTFGLVSVDRTTFRRTAKPSLGWLGRVAKDNGSTF